MALVYPKCAIWKMVWGLFDCNVPAVVWNGLTVVSQTCGTIYQSRGEQAGGPTGAGSGKSSHSLACARLCCFCCSKSLSTFCSGESSILDRKHVLRGWLLASNTGFSSSLNHCNFHPQGDPGGAGSVCQCHRLTGLAEVVRQGCK